LAAEEISPEQSGQQQEQEQSRPELEVVAGQEEPAEEVEAEAGEVEARAGEEPQDKRGSDACAGSLGEVLDTPALPLMLDVPMEVTVEIDRVRLSLAEVLSLQPGAVVQLNRVPGEPLDLLVNGRLVARGEIVVVNDVFAFRVTEIVGVGAVGNAA